jgi:GLPGLI family protein
MEMHSFFSDHLKKIRTMKTLLLFAASLTLMALSARAQQPEKAQLVVHYKFIHVRDTTNRAHPYTENMALYIGKGASVYRSYENMLEDARFKKEFEEQLAKSPDGHVRVDRHYTGSSTEYYQFPNEQKLFKKTKAMLFANSYLMEDPMPLIKWKISSETANIGELHCQKATTRFFGRDYTAWFCPDLPEHTGPWKLNGLPGVIVDAHDAKNEVVFKFDGVEKVITSLPKSKASNGNRKPPLPMLGMSNADPNLIELPADAIKTTQKQFDKLNAAMHKDPNAVAQAMTASQGGDGPKTDVKVKAGTSAVINNPIELPEKK